MMRKAALFTICVLILLFSACSESGLESGLVKTGKAKALLEGMPDPALADSQNKFGIDVLTELFKQEDNVIVSPLSLGMAFHLVTNGADETAEQAILNCFGAMLDKEQLNKANAQLMRILLNPDKSKITDKLPAPIVKLANAVFIDEGRKPNLDFAQTAMDFYRASMYTADFPTECIKVINSYIEKQTEGLIKDAVKELDPDTVMAIVNTLYFEAKWKLQFNKDLTDKAQFYGTKKQNKVDMMHLNETIGYYEDDKLQAVSLDYAGEEYAMAVLLPKSAKPADILSEQGFSGLNNLLQMFDEESINLALPKFKIDCNFDLMDTAKALGMGDALEHGKGSFPYLMEKGTDLQIGDIIHCTSVEVTETGTKAAAATVIGMRETSIPISKTMTVDKPFAFAIYHKPTNTVLFLGVVSNL